MSGRLIILPKKSWNVWNRENIAKVRNDEKEHCEKMEKERNRQLQVDSEARLDLLKKKNKSEAVEGQAVQPKAEKLEHVNFFADVEQAMGSNPEHEAEKKAKEMVEMRRQGIAPLALGGSVSSASKDQQPWYLYTMRGEAPPPRSRHGATLLGDDAKKAIERETRRKGNADPMAKIIPGDEEHRRGGGNGRTLEAGEEAGGGALVTSQRRLDGTDEGMGSKAVKKKRKHGREKKKHKCRKKRRHQDNRSETEEKEHDSRKKQRREESSPATRATPESSISQLRAKREKREAMERARTSFMLSKHGVGEEAEMMREHALRYYKKANIYNNQFNPTGS